MALNYGFTPVTQLPLPPPSFSERRQELVSLVGRRVCVQSGLLSITARLGYGPGNSFGVTVENGSAYADGRLYTDQVRDISYSKDTLTVDGVVAFIYLR